MAKTTIKTAISLDTTAFQRGMAKSQKSINKFASNALRKFGAIAGAAGLGMMARAAIDLGSKISDLAVQLNIGTDELQVLDFAAREAGVSTEILSRGLRNVQLRTEEAIKGNKSYGDAFRTLGIDIVAFKALSVEKKLEEIAKAQANATDKAAAYNAVSRILGEKAGPALQEVLQNLAGPQGYGGLEEAAKRAGEVMSAETIAKMDEAADRIESFKRKLTVLAGEIIAKVMPALQLLKEGLGIVGEAFASGAIRTDSITGFLKSIATDPKGIKDNYREMWKELRKEDESFQKNRADRAVKAKEAWAEMNGDMVKSSQEAAAEIKAINEGTTIGGTSGGTSKSGAAMGLGIEQGEFEARNDFLRRREKARNAHLTLNEKLRTQAMTGESAGIDDALVLAAQGGGTSAGSVAAETTATATASIAETNKVIADELTRTK